MIAVRNITKRYGDTTVVDDVSLEIPRGGITSIIGANGAGKSTLLSIVSRLLEPDAGQVTVDDLDVATARGEDLARRLSILRQDNHLSVRLTVRELVTFGRFPHSRGSLTATDHRAIEEAIEFLELGPYADRHLDRLSGGQRQRAFVAMILCQQTDYLLLDEPLNNLDLRHAVGMMRLLRRMADELDRTIVLVVHDINFASCHSDRIVAMRDGRVVADGAPSELMHAPTLHGVFDVDVAVHEVAGDRIGVFTADGSSAGSPTRRRERLLWDGTTLAAPRGRCGEGGFGIVTPGSRGGTSSVGAPPRWLDRDHAASGRDGGPARARRW